MPYFFEHIIYGAVENINYKCENIPPAFLQNARRGDKFGQITYGHFVP
jgi:hypothetical protein